MRFVDVVRGLGAALLSLAAIGTSAHPSPSSEVLLSAGASSLEAEVTLPVDELKLAFPGPLLDAAGSRPAASDAQMAAYLAGHVRPVAPDGRAWAVKVDGVRWALDRRPADVVVTMRLTPPTGAPLGTLTLGFDAIAHAVPNHNTLVALQASSMSAGTGPNADIRPHLLGSLYYGHHSVAIRDAAPGAWSGFGDLFALGMRHIAEGTDHLLFLLTLLLPAALRAENGRWAGFAGARPMVRNLLGVVTAFTIGHSLTLALGAAGWFALPERPVEVAIALSILVSAAHAWGPIFPRREGWIAGFFGLVHGLAFASALHELHLQGTRLAAGVLAFNLGIETVQALLVLLVAPLLVLLARGGYYRRVRQATAVVAACMALVWVVERVTGLPVPGFA